MVTAAAWLDRFPGLRIVSVLRHPLDALGTLPARYADLTPGLARPQERLDVWADRWRMWTQTIRQTMSAVPLSCEIRYESICADPMGAARVIARAVGLDCDFDGDALGRLAIKDWKVGNYRDWIEAGDVTEKQLAPLRELAEELGFRPNITAGGRTLDDKKDGRLERLKREAPNDPAKAELLVGELWKRGRLAEATEVVQHILDTDGHDLLKFQIAISQLGRLIKMATCRKSTDLKCLRESIAAIWRHPYFVSLADRFPDMLPPEVSRADSISLTKLD